MKMKRKLMKKKKYFLLKLEKRSMRKIFYRMKKKGKNLIIEMLDTEHVWYKPFHVTRLSIEKMIIFILILMIMIIMIILMIDVYMTKESFLLVIRLK